MSSGIGTYEIPTEIETVRADSRDIRNTLIQHHSKFGSGLAFLFGDEPPTLETAKPKIYAPPSERCGSLGNTVIFGVGHKRISE